LFQSFAGTNKSQPFAPYAAGDSAPETGFDFQSTHLNKPTAMTGHFGHILRI
jgi:hypothetical protein